MLFQNSVHVAVHVAPGVRSALAVACGLALSCVAGAASAADGGALETVFVTASRMPQLLQTAPIGATVITAEQMQRAGVADANEAVRRLGGVAARTDLANGREFSLDLRGFGFVSDQNIVVLVDGVRLNENELMPARLSAIPLDMIDRIEIVRGGNSVMWGDGASSGVVNVIMKKPVGGDVRVGRVGVAVETNKGHEVSGSGQWGFGPWALDASAKRVRSEGFRDNGAYKQDVGSVGLQWSDAGLRAGLRIQQEDQKARLPGQITLAQYRANRRAASTPNNYGDTRETRYQANVAHTAGAVTFQLDAALSERNASSFYDARGLWPAMLIVSSRTQQQVTPRVSYAGDLGGVKASATVGLDWQGWFIVRGAGATASRNTQDNQALFAQTDWRLPTATRVSVGARVERVHQLTSAYGQEDTVHAREFGVNQTLMQGLDLYGRLASSYRLANSDENGFTVAGLPLLPQRNRDREVGLKWTQGTHALTLRHFAQKTDNEIAYDPTAGLFGANVNLDPTRRRGTELEGRVSPMPGLTITGTWQQLTARYRAGANKGREIVLVSPHTGTLRASYKFDDRNTLEMGAQYLSRMRPNDPGDNCTRVPSSTLFDARYAWSDKVWTIALSGTNLADRKGYNYDFSCDATEIYPYAGRSVKLSVSRQF